jgi:hypothetical protein
MVLYRPMARHPLTKGAAGIAILAARPPTPGERPAVALARELGYARTSSELTPGLTGFGVPIKLADGSVMCVQVVFVEGYLDEEMAIKQMISVAERIAAAPLRT